MKNISVLGLGRIGIPTVAVLISKGYKVIGVDINKDVIDKINKRKSPIFEPGVEETLQNFGANLIATTSLELAIKETNISFIILPTPSTDAGNFSLKYFLPVCKNMGKMLKKKQKFHTVVIQSTVMPFDTRMLQKIIEKNSGKKCGKDFGLCYVPEFVALGTVMKNIENPDFVIIGESDKKSGDILESLYKDLCEPLTPIIKTNFINAELAKIALNVYLTMKISFSNTLAEMCEKLLGGNVDVITSVIGLDKRVGIKFLKGAIGYGGRCFPRDNKSFNFISEKIGTNGFLNRAVDKVNDWQLERIVTMVYENLPYNGTVAVLGIAFKPQTEDTTESPGLLIAESMALHGTKVCIYDPLIENIDLHKILKKNMASTFMAETCIQGSDVIVIANPCDEFKSIKSELLKNKIVIDCWRILKPEQYKDCKEYIAIGINNEDKNKEVK